MSSPRPAARAAAGLVLLAALLPAVASASAALHGSSLALPLLGGHGRPQLVLGLTASPFAFASSARFSPTAGD